MRTFTKSILVTVISICALLFSNCKTGEIAVDKPASVFTDESYIITRDGNRNNPSSSGLMTEYDEYICESGQSEAIHLGGKYNDAKGNAIRIMSTGIENTESAVTYITYNDKFSINSSTYYSVNAPFNVAFSNTGDWSAKVNQGTTITDTNANVNFTPSDYKMISLKVLPWPARELNFFLYQQAGSRCYGIIKENVSKAFNEMGVIVYPDSIYVPSGSIAILPNQIIEVNWSNTKPYTANPFLQYAYKILYPNKTFGDAMWSLAKDYHLSGGRGALFLVSNYKTVGGEDKDVNGITTTDVGTDPNIGEGEFISPAIAMIFVDKIRGNYNSTWENKAIAAVTAHELGHLWCFGFTDSTHVYWHNGTNANTCLMARSYEVDTRTGNPSLPGEVSGTETIFNTLSFCEGHKQRGRNISWSHYIYSPLGQTTPIVMKYSASQSSTPLEINNKVISQVNNIEIRLETDTKEIIQGQLWGCFAYIKNIGNSKISIPLKDLNLSIYHKDNDYSFNYDFRDSYATITIEPFEEYILPLEPFEYRGYNEVSHSIPGVPWYYWYPGDYTFKLSLKSNENIKANELSLIIKEVPDSLKPLFNGLLNSENTFDKNKYLFTNLEDNLEKFKGSFFEKEYYFKLLISYNYFFALQDNEEAKQIKNLALERVEYFILKYPNQPAAIRFYDHLTPYESNKQALKELNDSLNQSRYLKSRILDYRSKSMSHLEK